MRAKRIARDTSIGEIPMTPMIDVVFLLLVFFVLSVKPMDLLAHQEVSRPQGAPGTSSPVLTLEVFDHGYALNGRAVDQVELARLLKKLGDVSTEQTVRVVSATDARHVQLVSALDACAAAGLTQIALLSATP